MVKAAMQLRRGVLQYAEAQTDKPVNNRKANEPPDPHGR